MHVHGFPNMFVVSHMQGAFTVNYPHLLDVLEDSSFTIREVNEVIQADIRPFIVLTSNAKRELSDPFLRRCFVLHLSLPDDDTGAAVREALSARGAAHFPDCPREILSAAADLIARRRLAMRRQRQPAPDAERADGREDQEGEQHEVHARHPERVAARLGLASERRSLPQAEQVAVLASETAVRGSSRWTTGRRGE